MKIKRWLPATVFVCAEAVLYYIIMTAGGTLLWVSQFAAICLCFIFSLFGLRDKSYAIPIALAFTVGADYFLVAHHPQLRLWGMLFFLGTQGAYAFLLHKQKSKKAFLWLRLGLSAISTVLCFAVLGKRTDALSVISLCYYANLITNIIMAFAGFSKNRLFAVGLALFLLCDTIVGLQVACEGYLPIKEGSFLHSVVFSPFNSAWMFYLPSQVIIALCAIRKTKK